MSLTLQSVTISYAASPSALSSCLPFTFQYVKLLHLVLPSVALQHPILPYTTLHYVTLHHIMLPHLTSHFSSFTLPTVRLHCITLRYLNLSFITLQHLLYPHDFFSPIALPCPASPYITLHNLLLTSPLQTPSSQTFPLCCIILCYFTQHFLYFIQHCVYYATSFTLCFTQCYALLPCIALHNVKLLTLSNPTYPTFYCYVPLCFELPYYHALLLHATLLYAILSYAVLCCAMLCL